MSATTSLPTDLSRPSYAEGPAGDRPLPLYVSAAALVTASLGCWAIILYVASLI